jgi:hypothetical protein
MAWWTKAPDGIQKHDGKGAKVTGIFRLAVHRAAEIEESELGLYRKDPTKHPDAVNELPALLARARRKR